MNDEFGYARKMESVQVTMVVATPAPQKPTITAQDVVTSINLFNKLPLGRGKVSAGATAKTVLAQYIEAQIEQAKNEAEATARVDAIMELLGVFF